MYLIFHVYLVLHCSDEERIVVLERPVGGGTFGYHVLGSQPTRISAVEAGRCRMRDQL